MAKKSQSKVDEKVTAWMNRLADSRKFRDEIADKRGWKRMMDEYRFLWPMLEGKLPYNVAPINLVYSFVKTEVPSLYFRDPFISVNPRRTTSLMAAKIQQEVINHKWRAKKMKREIKRAIVPALVVGHAWIKSGYTTKTVTVEGSDKQKKEDTPELEVDERITNEDVFSYTLDWDEVLFSKDAKHANEDAHWMAYRFVRPTEAIKASKRYQNTENLKPNFTLFGSKDTESIREGDMGMTIGWEIWDKDSCTKFAVAEGHGEFIQEKIDWPYPFDDFPVSMLAYTEDPLCPYPLSSIGPWEKQILEKIKIRAMEINHIKRWNRQGFIKKGVLSKQERDKYLENVDGTLLEAKSANLGADILFPTYPNFQPDAYAVEDRIDQDMQNVNSQPAVRRGASTQTKSRTLGELESLDTYATVQSNERQDVTEDFCEDIASKQIALMREFFDIDQVAEISDETPEDVKKAFEVYFKPKDGESSERYFGNSFMFNKRDLEGDTTIEIKAGSTLPLNRENRQKVLQAIITSAGQYVPQPVLAAMVKEYVMDFDIKSIEKAYEDAEAEEKIKRVVSQSLEAERQQVRTAATTARTMGLGATGSGVAVPEVPS